MCLQHLKIVLLLEHFTTLIFHNPPCSPFVTSHLNLLENYETKVFCLLLFAIIFILSYAVYFYSLPWLWSVVVVVVVGVQVQRLRGLLGDALPVPSFNRYDSCARSTLKTESFIHTIFECDSHIFA